MPIQHRSNRVLHARNSKSVAIAQQKIQQVADMAQEQYVNALAVNGYDALIYNRLTSGRRCTCSTVFNHAATQVLDSNGHATEAHIQSLLTGAEFSIEDYGVQVNPKPSATGIQMIKSLSPEDYPVESIYGRHKVSPEMSDPLATDVVETQNLEDAFAEVNLGAVTAQKCALCYGSTYVGGYSLHNGNRFVLDATYPTCELMGYTVANETYPNLLKRTDNSGYIAFIVTLPVGVVSVDRIKVWNNSTELNSYALRIGTNLTNLTTLDTGTILEYATGTPCLIVVSEVDDFSHVELQFNMSTVPTYIEYPRLSKTGDLSVLEAIDSVQIIVSPLVPSVQPWDIIVDNVFKKSWRVTSSNWFNDRNLNVHGWDVQARLVQSYEVFTGLSGRFLNTTRYVSTRLPRK